MHRHTWSLYPNPTSNFINVKTDVKLIGSSYTVYDNIINNFNISYRDVKIINKSDWYNNSNYQNLLDIELQDKYDLIIFDTYKNIVDSNELSNIVEEWPKLDTENINRFISSINHNKILLQQIMFSCNKLTLNGELILLFSGFDNMLTNQLLNLLKLLFNSVILLHSDKDYSFRYHVICKNFNNNEVIKNLNEMYDKFNVKSDNLLISISDNLNNIDSINNINNLHLVEKFMNINKKIDKLKQFMTNELLISKIYNSIYYNQLLNSYLFCNNFIIDLSHLNHKVFDKLNKYKINLFNKLLLAYHYDFNIESSNISKFKIILDQITNNQIDELFSSIKYIELFDLIIYDKKYIINEYIKMQTKIGKCIYIKDNSINKTDIIQGNDLNKLVEMIKSNIPTIKINFYLNDICPLFMSIIYILTNNYKNIRIIKESANFTLIFTELSIKETNINKFVNKISNIDRNLFLVQIDDFFITSFNNILKKLILKEIMLSIRYKFIFNGKQFTESIYEYKINRKKSLT